VGHERNRGVKEDAKVLGLSNMKKITFIYKGEEDKRKNRVGILVELLLNILHIYRNI